MTSITPPAATRPPIAQTGPLAWARKNLFSDWFNSILTVVVASVLLWSGWGLVTWIFSKAQWPVVENNLGFMMTGLYPQAQYWRMWIIMGLIVTLSGLSWGILGRNQQYLFGRSVLIGIGAIAAAVILFPLTRPHSPILFGMVALTVATAWVGQQAGKRLPALSNWLAAGWFLVYIASIWLIGGGLGILAPVRTENWGGLVLTLLMAVTGIALCFPFGIALAIGRRSELPIVQSLSVAYIELVRGVPLITILVMGQVMIPLFLPEGVRPDRILRAIIALTIFSSAYLAENVRAGLQSVPRGQSEASVSLGLNKPLTLILIVLPQALKTAIPAIVGQFISLFQDTTLLAPLGLLELLGMANTALSNPNYLGRYAEAYAFIGVLYWFFCYAMALGSRKLEQQLNTTH
ncbi:MAG: amino acid ABC transporter permease [Leptolyngbya sp. DLM2.Bin15]|nr:MAG: amino acid ABC transporter permease [Leptolyngbya sp. DLM2.Bin15]